jgi:hypothetical protein
MWRSACALIAAVWFFASVVFVLNPLIGFAILALAFVDWDVLFDGLFGDRITITPREPHRPADD